MFKKYYKSIFRFYLHFQINFIKYSTSIIILFHLQYTFANKPILKSKPFIFHILTDLFKEIFAKYKKKKEKKKRTKKDVNHI